MPTGGFITAVILLVWLLAYAADDFAHRAEAPIEAAVPSGVLFLVGTALGGNRNRLLATALWLAAAALTVAVLRVERSEGAGWFGGTRRRAVATTVRVGAGLAAAAVIIGVIAGPALPGASSDPLVDTRQGRSSRTTLSPLVDIQARLVNQSDEELFTVASPRPAYWRLTALDDYDLRIWRSSRSYGDASGTLSGGLRDNLSTPLDHIIHITGLDSVWLPAAFAPRSVSIPDQVRYDAESGSLLIRRSSLPTGLTYELTSVVPNVDAATVEATAANGTLPPVIADHYLDLPSSYPDRFRQLATQITANATTPYDKALALQNWFRTNFTYDLNVAPGHGETAIDTFLSQRRGYCEQFAGTYAAFARSIGLPSRVAVGFTPGDLGADGLYHVRGRNAHAWPEVYLSGVGWLAFEPTPGRGEPGAEGYTGVPAAQDGGAPQTPARPCRPRRRRWPPAPPTGGPKRRTGNEQVLAVPNLGGGGAPAAPAGRRRSPASASAWSRWRSSGSSPSPRPSPCGSGSGAGAGAARPRRRTGSSSRGSTPWTACAAPGSRSRRARRRTRSRCASGRCSTHGSTSPTQELGELADQATAAAYSGHLDGGDPDRCEDLRDTLQHRAVARLPITRRLVWRFLPVSLRA